MLSIMLCDIDDLGDYSYAYKPGKMISKIKDSKESEKEKQIAKQEAYKDMKTRSALRDNRFYRIIPLAIILFILNVVSVGISAKNRPKEEISGYVDSAFEDVIDEQDNKSAFKKNFNLVIEDDIKKADFILTSDSNAIDTTKEYETLGYTPLILLLNTKTAKNLSQDFITLEDDESGSYTCEFKMVIDAILNNKGWKSLGKKDDSKIIIYCPKKDTLEGKLFYDFLLITLNNGKYPEENLEEIKKNADAFLSSKQVVQTDVVSKVLNLNGNLNENNIYIWFEADLLQARNNDDFKFAYPSLTVVKKAYIQYNGENGKKLKEIFDANSFALYPIEYGIHFSGKYRTFEDPNFNGYNTANYYNQADGINYYELE